MNVLLLAPQPFYRERGTPIAVRLLAETLCSLGHAVDLLVYHEGEDISFPGLRLLPSFFEHRQAFSELLVPLPASGDVPDDGGGPQDFAPVISDQGDGELQGNLGPVLP